MRRAFVFVCLAIGVALIAAQLIPAQAQPAKKAATTKVATDPTKKAAPQSVEQSADETAIRGNIDAFVKAFNAKQSKAIAELFLPEGQVITEDGETHEGRDAIEESFDTVFAEEPNGKIEVNVESIRFIGSDLAVEVGSTKEMSGDDETPELGRYTALHMKRDGKWMVALVRDSEGQPPTNHERLQPLGWLVGQWIDDGGSAVVSTTCRWSKDKNFLLQEIDLRIGGQDAMHVTQRIGWDPMSKRIRSWVFDSEGGFGEAVWARDANSWVIKSTGVRPDGAAGSSTSVIVPTGTDGYVWRVGDRVIGDEVQPPLEVKVVRKPPEPTK